MGLVLYLIIGVVYLLYKWATSTFYYFEKRGIPFRKPIPLFGNNLNAITRGKLMTDYLQMLYREFKDEKFSGIFEFRSPVVFLRDPKIIKQLAVKEFDHFMDHRTLITEEMDPLVGKFTVDVIATCAFGIEVNSLTNPDNELRAEIDEISKELTGKIVNYEQLQKMKYMDAFVCETLRKWPAAPVIEKVVRICLRDYELKYDDKYTCLKRT
ncbi:unnamed protein product [Diamesa hyperborea]